MLVELMIWTLKTRSWQTGLKCQIHKLHKNQKVAIGPSVSLFALAGGANVGIGPLDVDIAAGLPDKSGAAV